jgi:hypothetical protein
MLILTAAYSSPFAFRAVVASSLLQLKTPAALICFLLTHRLLVLHLFPLAFRAVTLLLLFFGRAPGKAGAGWAAPCIAACLRI